MTLVLALYAAFWVIVTAIFQTNIVVFSYYVVDYSQGFVRRGLAGEVLNLFPADLYFTSLLFLRWLVSALFIVGLIAVAWVVAVRFGRSERQLMLALLIVVLPFGFARGVVLPSPDLLGAAALAAYAVVLTATNRDRSIILASAGYGLTIAMLAFIHEAVPLLLSLGSILAIVALGACSSIQTQRLSAFFALAPGLAATFTIWLTSLRDVSPHCARLPYALFKFNFSMFQATDGQYVYVDFHDWVCTYIVGSFARTPADAFGSMVRQGPLPWIMSTAFGITVVAVTVFFISRVSGVAFGRFVGVLQHRPLWILFAIALLVPVFATAGDWGRWWVAVSFNVGLVFLLYAAGQPDSAHETCRRGRALFAVGIVLLALFPFGTVAQVGTNPPLQASERV